MADLVKSSKAGDEQGPTARVGSVIKGKWTVEGDAMCFEYEGSPKDCWDVEIRGDQVRWVKGGAGQGSGTIMKGNANGF